MAEVVIYTRQGCPYCRSAKALLEIKGVEYREVDITRNRALEAEMIERSGGRRTVPQIFIDGVSIGGSDDLHRLDDGGKLDEMLGLKEGERKPVEERSVAIIGSGPAGLTAAVYAARAELKPLVVEGLLAGGQLMNTTDVENYPGFPDGIQGPELMELFKRQAARFGAEFVPGDAVRVDFGRRPFRVWTEDQEIRAWAVIVATGASPRHLGVPGEEEYAGKGVSYCATCDGFFFRGEEIVVVGGGDTAVEEALFLTRFGRRVTVVHRRDRLRASRIMAQRALAHPKIRILWDTVVEEVLGDGKKVGSLRVRNVKTGETDEIPCGGFFVGIGHVPNTSLFRNVLDMNDEGYLKLHAGSSLTNVEGVFAAGDVHDHVYRQAITAAGAGCRAAIECERWLASRG